MSPYRIAIDQTINAIDARSKQFRNLIVCIVLLLATSILCAAGTRTLRPLSALLLLLPACSTFLAIDARLLISWRSHILNAWVSNKIDVFGLRVSLTELKSLPPQTLHGMLSTLPTTCSLLAEHNTSHSTRLAIAAAITSAHASEFDVAVLKAIALGVASFTAMFATVWPTWRILLFTPMIYASLLASKLLLRRCRSNSAAIAEFAARGQPDFDRDNYRELTSSLQIS